MPDFEYLNKLNEQQRKVATTVDGPLLIVAGAGSGKTTTLINRVAYMVDIGIAPESILLLTFTNNAADTMVERAGKLSNPDCKKITACTYHSFCAKLLRKYAKTAGLDPGFTILSPTEIIDAMNLVKSRSGKYELKGFPPTRTIAAIRSNAVNKGISIENEIQKYPEEIQSYVESIKELLKEVDQYKKEKSYVDYDDLLLRVEHLFQDKDILSRVSDSYQYVMVDEFQDSNRLQESIVTALCKEHRNIAVVGDDYQSIYRFRGSDVNNILHFHEKWSGCKKVVLDRNYRSTKEILDVANTVMQRHATFGFPKIMKDNHKSGAPVYCVPTEDQTQQGEWVLKMIAEMIESGINPEEIAILERNSRSSLWIERGLDTAGIPYRKYGGIKFTEHECVQDMIAFLKAVVSPGDEISWFRVLDCIYGIGEKYAHEIMEELGKPTFLAGFRFCKRQFFPEMARLRSVMETVRGYKEIEKQFDTLCEYYLGLRSDKAQKRKTKNESLRTEMFLKIEEDKEILSILREMVLKESSILGFLDTILIDPNMTGAQEEKDKPMVTISTVHSAKGMEWDNVFIIDSIEGIFPGYFPNLDEEEREKEREEELRCYYVALTRARERLFIITPVTAVRNGEFMTARPSSFLNGCWDYLQAVNIKEPPNWDFKEKLSSSKKSGTLEQKENSLKKDYPPSRKMSDTEAASRRQETKPSKRENADSKRFYFFIPYDDKESAKKWEPDGILRSGSGMVMRNTRGRLQNDGIELRNEKLGVLIETKKRQDFLSFCCR